MADRIRKKRYHTWDVVWVPPIGAAVVVAVGLLIFSSGGWEDPASWVAAIVGLLPWIVFAVRGPLLGLKPESDGVHVRNWLRTFRVSWDEIERFSVERTPYGGIQAAIHTKSEPDVRYVSGIGHRWLSSVEKARRSRTGRIVDELNELLEQQRSAATDTDE